MYEGVVKNNYLYQGAFAELDEELGWTDFPLRDYDAQIGRWVQQDPYQEFSSPYSAMANDPVNNIDPSGGIYIPLNRISKVVSFISQSSTKVLEITGKVTEGLTLLNKASIFIHLVNSAISIINIEINTSQVGGSPFSRGWGDAFFNATVGGLHDVFWGTNLSEYDSQEDKIQYLKGRIAGDQAALVASAATVNSGLQGGARGALVSGGSSAIVGTGVAIYGGVMGAIAISDLAWARSKLQRIQMSSILEDLNAEYEGKGGSNNANNDRGMSDSFPDDGNSQDRKISKDAEKIGNGHAWDKHKLKQREFPEINTRDEFKRLIDKVKCSPNSMYKKLANGRKAWYDKSTNTLVITDPTSVDGGTMYRPIGKLKYFYGLK